MKKSTKIIIAIISVLAVAGITVGILFATGVLGKKNPQKKFIEKLKAATDNTEGISYNSSISKLKKAQNEPSISKGKMSVDLELQGELAEYKDIAEALSKLEISYESKANPSSKAASAIMNIKYDGKELGTAELVTDDSQMGIKIPDMYDKYLTIKYDEIVEMLEDEGLDIDTLTSSMEDVDVEAMIEILDISDEEISRIVERYINVLEETLPEDNYSSKKEKITVNGKEINATGYTVKISDEDLVDLVKAILESLKEDDATIDLIVDKANKLMKLSGESMTISKNDVLTLIGSLESSIEEVNDSSDEELKITLYEHDNAVVRTAFEMEDDAIYIDSMKDGDTTNMALIIKDSENEMKPLTMSQTKKGEGSYTTKMSVDLGEMGSEFEGMKFDITVDTEETDNSSKANGTIKIEAQGLMKVALNLETEVQYTNVSIDELTSSNTTQISKMTTADQEELAFGLIDYIDDKMDIIKDIATTLGYEDEVDEFEQQLNLLKTQISAAGTTSTTEPTEE